MDLKQYFRKIREIEASLIGEDVLVVSLETSDGGKAGTVTEVPKYTAAKLILESRAALASEEQIEKFRRVQTEERVALEKAAMAKRIQVAILAEDKKETLTLTKRDGSPIEK